MIDVRASCKTLKLPDLTVQSGYTGIFVPYCFQGLSEEEYIGGRNIWSDGTNIYHSNSNNNRKLNKETKTWEPITWNGLPTFDGQNIWSDGSNIYYSYGNTQYKLDISTNTWERIEWNGLTSFSGYNVWTDGVNIYYSASSTQFKLNKETNTWETVDWGSYAPTNGNDVWSDGIDIYETNTNRSIRFNKETNTWVTISFSGTPYTGFYGENIWSDGTNIYFTYGINATPVHRKLNKETKTWEDVELKGYTSLSGEDIWSDGTNIYHSSFIVLPTTAKLYSFDGQYHSDTRIYDWAELTAFGNGITFAINGKKYYTEEGTTWRQWIESEYNTAGYVIDDTEGVVWYGTECQVLYSGNTILGSAEIVSGASYDHNSG